MDWLLPFEFEVTHAPGRVLGFADYLSRHPSEKIDAASEIETTPLEKPKAMNLPRAPDSILRVESMQDVQQAEKAKERKGNQPIKSQERYVWSNKRKLSAVQNLTEASVQRNRKTMLNNAPEGIDKTNDPFLPANYEADKMLQKVIQLVKTKDGT